LHRAAKAALFVGSLALALGGAVPALAQGEATISEISIVGNVNVSRQSILTALSSVDVEVGSPWSEDARQSAITAVEGMGYFGRVDVRAEGAPQVVVTVDVLENPKVTRITFEGNVHVTNDQLLAAVDVKVGEVLRNDALDNSVRAVRDLYIENGYAGQVVDVSPDAEGAITFIIAEQKIEEIRITGLRKTKPYVVRREMKLKVGDVLNINELVEDQRAIWNLGFFENVEHNVEMGSDYEHVIVELKLTEGRTGQVLFGIAHSSTTGWLGRAEIAENNWRGTGRGLNLIWERGGYGNESSLEAGYYEPWLDKKHSSLSVRAFNKIVYRFASTGIFEGGSLSEEDTRYNERRKGASMTWGRPLAEATRFSLGLRHENVTTLPIEGYEEPPVFIKEDGTITSASVGYSYNTRDYYIDPATGWYNSAGVEYGFGKIKGEGDTSFFKYRFDLRRYITVGRKRETIDEPTRVLAFRALGGFSSGGLPFFEQYFLGGGETLRGYIEDRFWGTKMVLGSVEYRMPVASSIQGVLFADAGDAWGSPDASLASAEFKQDSKFRFHLGYGFGIRVKTPLGPLRIDYGIGSEGSRTHFSIGHVF
jgi:outer membrane protein insertion porin family